MKKVYLINMILFLSIVQTFSQNENLNLNKIEKNDSINLNISKELDTINKILEEESIYKSGLNYYKNNKKYRKGLFTSNLIKELSQDTLTKETLSKYNRLNKRGNFFMYGGLIGFYGLLPIFLVNPTGVIVLVMYVAETGLIWGTFDMINKSKYLSKSIWIYNKNILKRKYK